MFSSEIFVTGGPVQHDGPVYVSRDSDTTAFRVLQQQRYLTIIAPRQMGKTSLLLRIQSEFEKSFEYATIYLDLSPFNRVEATWQSWSQEVCDEILKQSRRFAEEDFRLKPPKTPAQFKDYLVSLSRQLNRNQVLFLLDEASAVPDKIRNAFYSVLRVVFSERQSSHVSRYLKRCNFVFAGVFEPEKLVEGENSPFNVSHIERLTDFSIEQTKALMQQLSLRDEVCLELSQIVHDWVGGQPYLTQHLILLIGQCIESDPGISLNRALVDSLIPRLLDVAQDNVDHLAKRVVADPKLVQWLLRMFHGESLPFTRAKPEVVSLELIGAIRRTPNTTCQFRNRIYEMALRAACTGMSADTQCAISPEISPLATGGQLEIARRALVLLETQAAGFGALSIPLHLQIELEEKRKEVSRLESNLGLTTLVSSDTQLALNPKADLESRIRKYASLLRDFEMSLISENVTEQRQAIESKIDELRRTIEAHVIQYSKLQQKLEFECPEDIMQILILYRPNGL